MKILIAYHANCADGFTAAWVLSRYLLEQGTKEEDIAYVACNYQDAYAEDISTLLENSEYRELFILDFSMPLEVLDYFQRITPSLYIHVWDHHRSAIKMYGGNPDDRTLIKVEGIDDSIAININQDVSGALHTHNILYGKDAIVPKLVLHVSDYDIWQFKLTNTKEINKYIRTVPMFLNEWDNLAIRMEAYPGYYRIVAEGTAIQKYHDELVAAATRRKYQIELAGEKGICSNCIPDLASDVGHELAKISGTYGATWYQEGNTVKFSLRSIGDYDVSELAAKFGGGGHKNAAGFNLSAPKEGELFPDEDSPVGITLWDTAKRIF